jgi:hypothetical protein
LRSAASCHTPLDLIVIVKFVMFPTWRLFTWVSGALVLVVCYA